MGFWSRGEFSEKARQDQAVKDILLLLLNTEPCQWECCFENGEEKYKTTLRGVVCAVLERRVKRGDWGDYDDTIFALAGDEVLGIAGWGHASSEASHLSEKLYKRVHNSRYHRDERTRKHLEWQKTRPENPVGDSKTQRLEELRNKIKGN